MPCEDFGVCAKNMTFPKANLRSSELDGISQQSFWFQDSPQVKVIGSVLAKKCWRQDSETVRETLLMPVFSTRLSYMVCAVHRHLQRCIPAWYCDLCEKNTSRIGMEKEITLKVVVALSSFRLKLAAVYPACLKAFFKKPNNTVLTCAKPCPCSVLHAKENSTTLQLLFTRMLKDF